MLIWQDCEDVETDSFAIIISVFHEFLLISIAYHQLLTFIPTSKVKIAEKEMIRINPNI